MQAKAPIGEIRCFHNIQITHVKAREKRQGPRPARRAEPATSGQACCSDAMCRQPLAATCGEARKARASMVAMILAHYGAIRCLR